MGEIAEMMLEGVMCQGCGELIGDGDGLGYPGYCSPQCQREHEGPTEHRERGSEGRGKSHACHCGKRFRTVQALHQHQNDKHVAQAAQQ